MRHPTPSLEPEEPSTLYLLNHRPGPSSINHLPTSPLKNSQHRPVKCDVLDHGPPPCLSRGFPLEQALLCAAWNSPTFRLHPCEEGLVHRRTACKSGFSFKQFRTSSPLIQTEDVRGPFGELPNVNAERWHFPPAPSNYKQKAGLAPFPASVLRICIILSSEDDVTRQNEVAKRPGHAHILSSVAQIFTVFQRGCLRNEDEAAPYTARVILPWRLLVDTAFVPGAGFGCLSEDQSVSRFRH